MQVAVRFWLHSLIWTGLLLLVLLTLSLAYGQGVAEVLAHLPTWAALSLALAAFPAGVAVSHSTFPEDRLRPTRLAAFVTAAGAVSVLMLTLGNVLGPLASERLAVGGAKDVVAEPARMSLGELRAEAKRAVELARGAGGVEAVRRWQDANRLVWHYVRRTDGTLLPLLFALIGLLTGSWSRRASRRELQQAQQWAMGLLLLLSTYLLWWNQPVTCGAGRLGLGA